MNDKQIKISAVRGGYNAEMYVLDPRIQGYLLDESHLVRLSVYFTNDLEKIGITVQKTMTYVVIFKTGTAFAQFQPGYADLPLSKERAKGTLQLVNKFRDHIFDPNNEIEWLGLDRVDKAVVILFQRAVIELEARLKEYKE